MEVMVRALKFKKCKYYVIGDWVEFTTTGHIKMINLGMVKVEVNREEYSKCYRYRIDHIAYDMGDRPFIKM